MHLVTSLANLLFASLLKPSSITVEIATINLLITMSIIVMDSSYIILEGF